MTTDELIEALRSLHMYEAANRLEDLQLQSAAMVNERNDTISTTLLALHYSHNDAVVYLRADSIVALNTAYEGVKPRKASGCKVSLSTGQDYMVRQTAAEIIAVLSQTHYGLNIVQVGGHNYNTDEI
jgi:hypothetical protein